jgi:hypothetical protein
MKNFSLMLFAALVISFTVYSAPRNRSQEPCSKCCTIIVPLTRGAVEVEKPEKISEEERDRQMFMGFLGIVSSFVKLFIDPQNIPEAKQNAMNIVNGVVQLAQVITRRSMTIRMQSRLMDYVLELVQNELDKLEVVVEE